MTPRRKPKSLNIEVKKQKARIHRAEQNTNLSYSGGATPYSVRRKIMKRARRYPSSVPLKRASNRIRVMKRHVESIPVGSPMFRYNQNRRQILNLYHGLPIWVNVNVKQGPNGPKYYFPI